MGSVRRIEDLVHLVSKSVRSIDTQALYHMHMPKVDRLVASLRPQQIESIIKEFKVEIHGINAMPELRILRDSRNPDDREVTLYCRGFLSSDTFTPWLGCHDDLVNSHHRWGQNALGWTWPSGRVLLVPPLLPPIPMLYKPAVLAGAAAAIIGAQIWYHWIRSQRQAVQRAHDLAQQLQLLRSQYDTIRIVSHSLGCRHVVEACQLLHPDDRPDYLHLCAPAFHDAKHRIPWMNLARERTFLYWTPKDMLLQTVYRTFTGGAVPFGIRPPCATRAELRGATTRYVPVKVCEHFEFLVHNRYEKRFSSFAAEERAYYLDEAE